MLGMEMWHLHADMANCISYEYGYDLQIMKIGRMTTRLLAGRGSHGTRFHRRPRKTTGKH